MSREASPARAVMLRRRHHRQAKHLQSSKPSLVATRIELVMPVRLAWPACPLVWPRTVFTPSNHFGAESKLTLDVVGSLACVCVCLCASICRQLTNTRTKQKRMRARHSPWQGNKVEIGGKEGENRNSAWAGCIRGIPLRSSTIRGHHFGV